MGAVWTGSGAARWAAGLCKKLHTLHRKLCTALPASRPPCLHPTPPPTPRQHDAVQLGWRDPEVRHPRGHPARVLRPAPAVLLQAPRRAAAGEAGGEGCSGLGALLELLCCGTRPTAPQAPDVPPAPAATAAALLRLTPFPQRSTHHPQAAEADLCRISNKVRFILAVVSGELKLSNRRKADIEAELEDENYDKLASQKKAKAQVGAGRGWLGGSGEELCAAKVAVQYRAHLLRIPHSCTEALPLPPSRQAAADPEEEGEEGAEVAGANYDYLLSMPLSSLTLEKVEALKKVRRGGSAGGIGAWHAADVAVHG